MYVNLPENHAYFPKGKNKFLPINKCIMQSNHIVAVIIQDKIFRISR